VIPEAKLSKSVNGVVPDGEGWFVLNARDAPWRHSAELGSDCPFARAEVFPELGINLNTLRPGQPFCMYHAENSQEDFLVLAGEALLLVEGQERPLRTWDLVHCPPWTEHVIVGAGDGPCVILAVGAQHATEEVVYPIAEVALRHGAGVDTETRVPAEAYARFAAPTMGKYREGDLPG